MKVSALQKARYSYIPKLPLILREDIRKIKPVYGNPTQSVSDQEKLKKYLALHQVDYEEVKSLGME